VLTAPDEATLVVLVQDHARHHHGIELTAAHVLAELHGEDHASLHAHGL
jgi:hypothetical protein